MIISTTRNFLIVNQVGSGASIGKFTDVWRKQHDCRESAIQLARNVHSFYVTSTRDISKLFVGMRRSLIAEMQEYAAQGGARRGRMAMRHGER